MVRANRLIINVLTDYSARAVVVVLGIFSAPFIVHRIGLEGYGLFTLVGSVFAFALLIQGGTGPAMIRYVTMTYTQQDYDGMNRYYGAGQLMLVIASVVCLVLSFSVAWQFPHIFDVTESLRPQSRWVALLGGMTAAFSIALWSPNVGFYAAQRYDISSLIGNGTEVFRMMLIVILFILITPSVVLLAIIGLSCVLIRALLQYVTLRSMLPELRLLHVDKSREAIRDTWVFSTFTFLSAISYVIHTSMDSILINKLISLAAVAPYALARLWSWQLRNLTLTIVQVTTPAVTALAASGEHWKIEEVLVRGTKYSLMISLPLAVLLSIFAEPIVRLWLGPGYEIVATLMPLLLIPEVFFLWQGQSNAVLTGLGYVKFLGILSLSGAIISVAVGIVLVVVFNMGLIGIALGTATSFILRNIFIMPVYTCRKVKISLYKYLFRSTLHVVGATVPCAILSLLIMQYTPPQTFGKLILAVAGSYLLYIITAYFLCIDAYEKAKVRDIKNEAGHIIDRMRQRGNDSIWK
jgi:O-antigen/teichoic acid export membrane protein